MKTSRRGLSRRSFALMCAAWGFLKRVPLAAESHPLGWTDQPDAGAGWQRNYRADAQIVLLSIPVLHRSGVGDGAAIWRESGAVRLLEFTGRSVPEHAAGLNRFGFIRELSRAGEAIYFGLMTSSPEESATDARKALHSNSKDVWFSAIEGRIGAGSIETTGARFLAPAQTSAEERESLIVRAGEALSGAPKRLIGILPSEGLPRPFLHALADLLSRAGASATHYAYDGRLYRLTVARAPDPKAAVSFRERHLIPPTAGVTRISGSLCRLVEGKPIDFRLWIQDDAPRPLPLRIEYQAKAYLRLTFEAQG